MSEVIELKSLQDSINGIGETVKTTLETKAGEIKAAAEVQIKSVKDELKKEIETSEEKSFERTSKVVKDEVTKLREEFEAKANTNLGKNIETKSFGERVAEAVTDQQDDVAKFGRGEKKSLVLELKAVGAVGTANVTGSTAHWAAQGDSTIRMNQNTMQHVRGLLPNRPFGPATDYYFMRENGAGEGTPATVAEGATKPQVDIDLIESSVKFETIAAWMLMSRKAMLNVPGLVGFLQARLPERLLDVEDAQILYGDGSTPNIKGILASGNFTAGSAAGTTPLVEKIINDISLLEDTHKRIANGIAMRPADYYGFFKNKAAGSGEYDLPAGVQFINGVLYILGIPVAKTTALTANDYVVGDFKMGAELLIQEAMRIEFFEQDSTNVRTNQVTVRIEETIALPVYGNNYFVKGSSALS